MKSRTFIASGGNEPVADGGAEGHSIFTAAVLRGLKELNGYAFSAEDLFQWYVRERVAGNSRQTPRFAAMANSGNDGGDFVFIGKSAVRAPTSATPSGGRSLNAAEEAWTLIKGSNRVEDFDDFVKAFPNSELAEAAKLRAGILRRENGAPSAVRAGQTKRAKDGLTYVWVPPGNFTMGCSPGDEDCRPDEKPRHAVTISLGAADTPVSRRPRRLIATCLCLLQ
jgi:hypothetical protein